MCCMSALDKACLRITLTKQSPQSSVGKSGKGAEEKTNLEAGCNQGKSHFIHNMVDVKGDFSENLKIDSVCGLYIKK